MEIRSYGAVPVSVPVLLTTLLTSAVKPEMLNCVCNALARSEAVGAGIAIAPGTAICVTTMTDCVGVSTTVIESGVDMPAAAATATATPLLSMVLW